MGRKLRPGDGRPHLGMAAHTWGWPLTPGDGHSHLGMAGLHLVMAAYIWGWRDYTWGRPPIPGDGGFVFGNGQKKRTKKSQADCFCFSFHFREARVPKINLAKNDDVDLLTKITHETQNFPNTRPGRPAGGATFPSAACGRMATDDGAAAWSHRSTS